MSTLLSARKRAEEFDALISRRPVEATRPELDSLATVVATLREHAQVAPRPDFALALREQLMAEAAVVLTGEAKALTLPKRRRGARERRLVAAATVAVFVGGTAGMAAASQTALPGDTLYPIKRTLERAEVAVNTNDAGKGRDLLDQARARLDEVESLLKAKGSAAARVPSTVQAFSTQAEQGTNLLAKSYSKQQDADTLNTVRTFAADSLAVLQELAKSAPPQAQEALTAAAQLLQTIDQTASSLCGSCASQLPPLQSINLFTLTSAPVATLEKIAKPAAKPKVEGQLQTSKPNGNQAKTATPQSKPSLQPAPKGKSKINEATGNLGPTVGGTVESLGDILNAVVPGTGDVLTGLLGNPAN